MSIPHLNNKEKEAIMREKYMATMKPVSRTWPETPHLGHTHFKFSVNNACLISYSCIVLQNKVFVAGLREESIAGSYHTEF